MKKKGTDEYEGFCVDLAAKIAKEVNFTYEIKPVNDSTYGAMLDNGTWTGMVGELVRHVSPKSLHVRDEFLL